MKQEVSRGGGGCNYLNALIFFNEEGSKSLPKSEDEGGVIEAKKREMGNSHQSGKNKRLGTYCTMTGCVKYPPEAHSHEFEMRPVISIVHFPPTLASCTGRGTEQVKS